MSMYGSIHTHFESRYDTANDLVEMVDRFGKSGAHRVAVTEHGVFSSYEDLRDIVGKMKNPKAFAQLQKDYPNIEPLPDDFEIVPGVEGYFGESREHLILIAKDYEGYLSLCKIISEANRNHDKKGNPIITEENLEKNVKKGHLICTSACIAGPFGHLFGLEKMDLEEKIAKLDEDIEKSGYRQVLSILHEQEVLKQMYKNTSPLKREINDAEKQFKKYGNRSGLNLIERRQEEAERLKNELETRAEEFATNEEKLKILKKKRYPAKLTQLESAQERLKEIQEAENSGENVQEAYALTQFFIDTFGKENFFFEIQNHGLDKEAVLYNKVISFAYEAEHPQFIASNDIHIGVRKSDPDYERALLRRNVIKYTRFNTYEEESLDDREYVIKSDEELREELLKSIKNHEYAGEIHTAEEIVDSAIGNIQNSLEQCHVEHPKNQNHYPKFCENENAEFEHRVREGIKKKFPNGFPKGQEEKYQQRLEYELDVIKKMGYAGYHLIVADYLEYGRLLGYLPTQEEIDNAPLSVEELDAYITEKGYPRVGYNIGPGRGCAIPGTRVLTTEGYIPIEMVKPGDIVYDFTGNPSTVLKKWEYRVDEPMLELTIWNGGKLTYTKDHKFYSASAVRVTNKMRLAQGYRYLDNAPESTFLWKKAEQLQQGDWVAIPKTKLPLENNIQKFDLSKYVDNKWLIADDELYYYNTNKLLQLGVSITQIAKKLGMTKKTVSHYFYQKGKTKSITARKIDTYLQETASITPVEWRTLIRKVSIPRYIELTTELAYLIGYYIADGWVRYTECSFAYNTETELTYRDNILRSLQSVLGDSISITDSDMRNKKKANVISVYCLPFAEFMRNLVPGKAQTKRIPDIFMSSNEDILKALLQGLFDGDGSYTEGYRAKYSTCNSELAYDVKRVLLHFGIPSCVRSYERKNPKWNDEWTVSFTTNEAAMKIFSAMSPSTRTTNNIVTTSDENYIFMRIKSVKEVQYSGFVYDLSVDTLSEPSYCTDVCAVHNSGAGSIACYALGITDVDPLPYNLLFERFLNIERVSMPDIDSDFRTDVRAKVVDYCKARYGEECICQIMTKSYGATKGNLRLAARYLGAKTFEEGVKIGSIDIDNLLKIANNVPLTEEEKDEAPVVEGDADEAALENSEYTKAELNKALTAYLRQWFDKADKLSKAYDEESGEVSAEAIASNEDRQIVDLAKTLDGVFTGYGQHAAGTIISGDRLDEILPLMWNQKKSNIETQCTMAQAESKGLLKMDFLGLENLDIITEIMRNPQVGEMDDLLQDYARRDEMLKDPAIFRKIFWTGMTQGVFQFESDGMKKMLMEFKPETFEDLILLVAAYRPGPIQYLDEIIKQKQYDDKQAGKAWAPATKVEKPKHSINIDNKALSDILAPTYGCIIYQEQVMQIFQNLAGYSLGGADLVRRAMSKKHLEDLIPERQAFIYGDEERHIEGCIKKQGISAEDANLLFDQMMEFAKYAFNKSHATAYAMVAMFTAYQKLYHTADFFRVSLDHIHKLGEIPPFVQEMPYFGIEFRGPSLKDSHNLFSVENDGKAIRFGLQMMKGFSKQNVVYEETIEAFMNSNPSVSTGIIEKYVKIGLFSGCWENDKETRRGWGNRHEQLRWMKEHAENFEKLHIQEAKIEELKNAYALISDKTDDESVKEAAKLHRQIEQWTEKANATASQIEIKRMHAATESAPKPETIAEHIENRKWETEFLSVPFDIDSSMERLNEAAKNPSKPFYKNTFRDLAKSAKDDKGFSADRIKVPAIVLGCQGPKRTKKGNVYYEVTLMDREHSIITRRFDNPVDDKLDGVFELMLDECRYYTCDSTKITSIGYKPEANCANKEHSVSTLPGASSEEIVSTMLQAVLPEDGSIQDMLYINGRFINTVRAKARDGKRTTSEHIVDDENFERS